MRDLCLIAGQGRLPELLRAACPGMVVAGLEGQAPAGAWSFRLETLGAFLEALRSRAIARVVFAGAIRRPAVDPARIEPLTAPLVPRLTAALGQGDDAALRAVVSIFEEAGLSVIGPDALLPDLLPAPGVLGRVQPPGDSAADLARAAQVLDAAAPADLGQGCVVAAGQVLAMEAWPGTDWMLDSVAALRGAGPLGRETPAGGVLVKRPKRGQDRRVDLPAIGPQTMAGAARAGLGGVAIEAGGVLVLDRAETVAAADAAGLWIWVRR